MEHGHIFWQMRTKTEARVTTQRYQNRRGCVHKRRGRSTCELASGVSLAESKANEDNDGGSGGVKEERSRARGRSG